MDGEKIHSEIYHNLYLFFTFLDGYFYLFLVSLQQIYGCLFLKYKLDETEDSQLTY
jgi:hypothetical protein